MKKEFISGIVGTILSSTGAITNVNDVLTIVSTIITIIGGIITLIVIPLLAWYKKSKQDGKITKEEIDEGVKIIKDGVDELKDKNRKDK